MGNSRRISLCSALQRPVAICALSSGASAHAATNDSGVTASNAAGSELEEVVVTAQKRSEDIQKTPIAITALSGDDLREEARNSLEQQLEAVPGVRLQNGAPNLATIFIRGIGPVVPGVDPTAAVNNDGVYQSTLGSSRQRASATILGRYLAHCAG